MKTKQLPQDDGTVLEVVEIPCCACEGLVSFGTPETTERPVFFHTMPFCDRFDTTNTPDQVVQYMRDCVDKQQSQN